MDCLANVDGLGQLCQQATPITIKTGMFLVKADFSFVSLSSFLTEADHLTAIAAGNMYPIQNVREIENQDADDAVLETSTGDKVFQFEGTRGEMLKFIMPLEMHKIFKAQYSLKNWRVIWLDKNGNLIATSPDGVAVQGLKFSYFRVKKQETPSPDGAAYTPVEYQMASIKEWDVKGIYGNPLWLASDLLGVLKVTLTNSVVAANIFTATVAWVSDSEIDPNTGAFKTFAIPGLVDANLNLIDQAGLTLTPTTDFTVVETTTPGTYTVDASSGGLTSGSAQVVASTTNLYKSAIVALTA
ncbi:hypothetical protein KAR91_36855 [Candidatus Pacearchaeota archaeon]|nr:hypothetical protein [Candidatus Pacearchaeota archaeon]